MVEASSGSTAVSEAYFARLIGLPFVAVMPRITSPGEDRADRVPWRPLPLRGRPGQRSTRSPRRLAAETGGHYIDQFTYAERATDWRGNNNIAESIFQQLRLERYPGPPGSSPAPAPAAPRRPSAATSATAALTPASACVDPENSAFFDGWTRDDPGATGDAARASRASAGPGWSPFVPGVIDRMIKVPGRGVRRRDARWCSELTGRRSAARRAPSIWGALGLLAAMKVRGERGSVVTLLCDGGERYARHLLRRRLAGRPGHQCGAVPGQAGAFPPPRRAGSTDPIPATFTSTPSSSWLRVCVTRSLLRSRMRSSSSGFESKTTTQTATRRSSRCCGSAGCAWHCERGRLLTRVPR